MKMCIVTAFVEVLILCSMLMRMPTSGNALTIPDVKELWAKDQLSSLLVFGDSSVDPGNNNRLGTPFKSNFLPYGINFVGGRPTGRFSDGKLATDFIAEELGFATVVPGFLDPNLTKADLLHAVSFASAGSGYDELTANLSGTLSLTKQVNYLGHYKLHLGRYVGNKMADEIVRKAVFVLSMGTNDYIQNYFVEPARPKQFTLDKYQDFLVSRLRLGVQGMQKFGARRLAVVGVPPLGCMPLSMTIAGDGINCVDKFNEAVVSLNSKIQRELEYLQTNLKMRILYIDAYGVMQAAIKNPKKFGFTVTSKGCCATGTVEIADACKGSDTCKDPKKYVFWDAVHPSESMYKILADEVVKSIPLSFIV